MSERIFCSEQNTREPMLGTAARVDVWLLLEYRPVWKARAHEDNALSSGVRQWLTESLERLRDAGFRPRLQFVRQPEIDSAETRLLLGCDHGLLQFRGDGYRFLDSVDVVAALQNPGQHENLEAPNYFVCTNGQRDLCCARFGLRSYAMLRDVVGPRVWQITHLGGHRFAPNILVLPDGLLYGRVAEDAVEGFVAKVEAGDVDFVHLRGRAQYPPHVQAAEIAAARPDLRLLHVEGDEQRALVTFSAGTEQIRVAVARSADPIEVSKNCNEPAEPVYPYRLVD